MTNAQEIINKEQKKAQEKALKAQKEAQEAQIKAMEEKQEKIVTIARDKIMPILIKENRTIPETKRVIETLAVSIQQGAMLLMQKNNVSSLELPSKIDEKYQDKDIFITLLEELKDEPLALTAELLQWLISKIDNDLKEQVKDKKFNDMIKEF